MIAHAPSHWTKRGPKAALLLPLAGLFGGIAAIRRRLFRTGLLRPIRLPVPVIVVGNISVGGSGKTPVVAWLVEALRTAGYTPGIVSRGHGGRTTGVVIVAEDDDPAICGDEPVLLAKLTGCPVAVGRDRPAAGKALLAAHPGCDVIVSDDGLQHYRLARDVEIVVLDEISLGNGWLLPAGPLREGVWRLKDADLVIVHGTLSADLRVSLAGVPSYGMSLEGREFKRVGSPHEVRTAEDFKGHPVHAIAGIGRPERFFSQLAAMGLEVVPHAFPDHHPYTAADLDFAPGEAKVLTAKDAVKCSAFAPTDAWEFPVNARIDAMAAQQIVEKLTDGSQVA